MEEQQVHMGERQQTFTPTSVVQIRARSMFGRIQGSRSIAVSFTVSKINVSTNCHLAWPRDLRNLLCSCPIKRRTQALTLARKSLPKKIQITQ